MWLCYVDESGDSGFVNSPSPTFTLAGVLVHETRWKDALDQLVAYRRTMKSILGIRMREEMKANQLIHNKGAWKSATFQGAHVGLHHRLLTYQSMMRLQATMAAQVGLRVFAVCILKDRVRQKTSSDPRELAWRFFLQRLERMGTKENERTMLFPDDGHNTFIRKTMRRMRMINYVPSGAARVNVKADNIIEDPNSRLSHDSYFVQLADLNAYAAWRHVLPHPSFPDQWQHLGPARHLPVNSVNGGPPGLVVWP